MIMCLSAAGLARAQAPDTLAMINGEALTSADLDSLIFQAHRSADMSRMGGADLERFLTKAINDRLIIQEALAMEMDRDEIIQARVREAQTATAVKAYIVDSFTAPSSVPDTEVRAFFEKYYWKIQIRRISVASEAEAASLLAAIRAGASMDSLARELSVDSRKYQGGLYNLIYWADLENRLRAVAIDLAPGELSPPFPYRDVYSFIRMEERHPVDEPAFSQYETSIRAFLLSEARKAAWRDFLKELGNRTRVETDRAVLAKITADSALVYREEFRKPAPDPVLIIDEDFYTPEIELRRTLSHRAMTAGTLPFDSIQRVAVEEASEKLLLRHAAMTAGYMDKAAAQARYEEVLGQALIEAYLGELIVPRIVFNRQEFQEYYEENQERWRGPDEMQLDMIILEDEATARSVAERLAEGADFGYLKKKYETDATASPTELKWVRPGIFSADIRAALEPLDVGETSIPVATHTGWMIFKLADRRPGQVASIEEVDGQIREVMFQREFNELMDEHLARLKELSEIQLNQAAIDAYFAGGS